MQKKIEEFVEKWKMLSEKDVVIAGVSGGADSVCLLLELEEMRRTKGFSLAAVHVNHALRGEAADADEAFVKALCEKRGIPCAVYHVDVRDFAKQRKLSEEEAGRELRRAAFAQEMAKRGGTKIALAHHMEDNAETFFLHLARGSRLKGLGGIYPVNGSYIRPLLCVSRTDIEAYLEARETPYCMDATNREDTYARNRIRNHVLPYFREEINPKTVEHVNGAMAQLREIQTYLEKQTEEAYGRCVAERDGTFFLREAPFIREEELLRGMVIRRMLSRAAGREKDLEEIHVESIRRLLAGQTGRRCDLPYGMRAMRTYEGVELTAEAKETPRPPEEILLDFREREGSVCFGEWDISWRIFANPVEKELIPKKTYTKWFDYAIIDRSVSVRTRRSGDRIVIGEGGASQKLKAFFINEKVPAGKRDGVLLLAEGSSVLWIVGYRQSKAYQVTEQTTTILEITINGGTLHGGDN